MSDEMFWVTDDGQPMGKCSDCNAKLLLCKGSGHMIEVGQTGKVENVICKTCWELLQRSGAKSS